MKGKNRFFTYATMLLTMVVLSAIALTVSAATVTGLYTFSSGGTISSTQMNANFTAVKTANDDNDARITKLEARKVTIVTYTGGNDNYHSSATTAQYPSISPLNLAFTKNSATSALQVTWNDTLVGHASAAGLGFCNFFVYIDGSGNSTSMVQLPLYTTSDASFSVSHTATFTGLAAGSHNVQLWLSTSNAGCYINAGGWTRSVTVVEIP